MLIITTVTPVSVKIFHLLNTIFFAKPTEEEQYIFRAPRPGKRHGNKNDVASNVLPPSFGVNSVPNTILPFASDKSKWCWMFVFAFVIWHNHTTWSLSLFKVCLVLYHMCLNQFPKGLCPVKLFARCRCFH